MPRPDFSNSQNSHAGKSNNFFSNLFRSRKEARQNAAEQVAKIVTNDTARNETAIVTKLESIDFLHSRLPKEVLEERQEGRPCGDLEYGAKQAQKILLKYPVSHSIDIRKIDEKLLTIAILFKQSVEQGDTRAATAAKVGLLTALREIRTKIPENQPELFKLFVETNAEYLEGWIVLIGIATTADRMERNINNQRADYDNENARLDAERQAMEWKFENDSEFSQAFKNISIPENDTPEARKKWNQAEQEAHSMMVNHRLARGRIRLKEHSLRTMEDELSVQDSNFETLYGDLIRVPVVTDPNQMNKYKERIDLMLKKLAESDQKIDESLQFMEEIEGRVEQLENAPGSIRAKEVAAEETKIVIDEINEMRRKRAGVLEAKAGLVNKELGLISEAELAEEKRLAEEKVELMEESHNEIDQTEDNDQILLND